jgi:hypothetical protein
MTRVPVRVPFSGSGAALPVVGAAELTSHLVGAAAGLRTSRFPTAVAVAPPATARRAVAR